MSTPLTPEPVDSLRGLSAYAPPAHPAPVDLVLSGNEGDHPPASLLEALAGREVDLLRRYPRSVELERQLAVRMGVEPRQVFVAAGGDEVIDRLCRAYLAPGRRVVLPEPTFVMFGHYARLAGAGIDVVAWPEGPYPTEAVLTAVSDDTAMIVVVSPNNPTGATASADDLRRLSAAAPHAVLVVDLAYAEYADEDLTQLALSLPNAIVVRTVSKAWGLAGLRVGYGAGAAGLIAPLRAAGGPFSVAGISLALAAAALRDGDVRSAAHVARVRTEREQLRQLLVELGADALPSQANFVLARPRDSIWLRDGLAGLGIAVRIFPGEEALAGRVRITCPGNETDFRRLAHALRATLRPEALLFDMDGVLADVSGSYRTAILETARSFGADARAEEIGAIKAQGDANNDWIVSQRLLASHGIDVGLAEVTARFEALYQGTGDAPGLWRNETLLPARELLERLAARLPLGVVTGRPRRDAERMLRQEGISDLFAVTVCMEDGPLKPDPAPVRTALSRLGVEHAWLVGDTPDDVRAARAAGVVPIGVPPPGDDPDDARASLGAAGAARVVDAIAEIEELLP